MKIELDNYLIETDERQYIVKVKKTRITNDGETKEYYSPIAYCIGLASALEFVPQDVIRRNDDICTIVRLLEQIKADTRLLMEGNK